MFREKAIGVSFVSANPSTPNNFTRKGSSTSTNDSHLRGIAKSAMIDCRTKAYLGPPPKTR